MLTIRLQRIGKKKKPSYRFVISENARDTQAPILENLGQYAPTQNPKILDIKRERVEYWLSKGAQTSNTVHNLLVQAGIVSDGKKKSVRISNKRQVKLTAKHSQAEEAKKQAEEAKKQAEEAKKAEAEEQKTSVEEVAPEATAEEPVVEETPVVEEKTEEVAE